MGVGENGKLSLVFLEGNLIAQIACIGTTGALFKWIGGTEVFSMIETRENKKITMVLSDLEIWRHV